MTVKELIELNQMITDCEITVRDNGLLVDQLNIGCAEGEKPPYPTRVPRDRKYAGAMNIRSEDKFKDAAYIPKSINAWDDGKDYWQVQWKRIPSAWLNLEVDSWEVWPSTRVCYSSPRRKRGNFNGQKIVITALYGGRTLEAPEEEDPYQTDMDDAWRQSIKQEDYADTCKRLGEVIRQEPCEDAISRQAAIDAFYKYPNIDWTTLDVLTKIKELPSVKPQYTDEEIQKMQDLEQAEIQKAYELGKPKAGHWIEHPTEEDYSVCSRCGIGSRRIEHGKNADGTKYIDIYSYRFCPYCGARMVEPQESEGKE